MDFSDSLLHRSKLWHQNRLPANENLSYYDLHVAGPVLHGGVSNPTRFHTYANLYPEHDTYVAFNTGEWPGCAISANDLSYKINSYEVPRKKVLHQRDVAAMYVGPGTTAKHRWDFALSAARQFNLPIAFYTIGSTQAGSERVIYLRVMAAAPIAMVVAEFKKVTPQFNFD